MGITNAFVKTNNVSNKCKLVKKILMYIFSNTTIHYTDVLVRNTLIALEKGVHIY